MGRAGPDKGPESTEYAVVVARQGVSACSDLVHEAIALHAAVGKASKMAPEIALVHFGAGMDVVGFRAEDLATDTVRHIVDAYPRHGFKKAFSEALEVEVRRKPSSHMAGHIGLGFLRKIQSAPFAE